jgi:hypothetical protein
MMLLYGKMKTSPTATAVLTENSSATPEWGTHPAIKKDLQSQV